MYPPVGIRPAEPPTCKPCGALCSERLNWYSASMERPPLTGCGPTVWPMCGPGGVLDLSPDPRKLARRIALGALRELSEIAKRLASQHQNEACLWEGAGSRAICAHGSTHRVGRRRAAGRSHQRAPRGHTMTGVGVFVGLLFAGLVGYMFGERRVREAVSENSRGVLSTLVVLIVVLAAACSEEAAAPPPVDSSASSTTSTKRTTTTAEQATTNWNRRSPATPPVAPSGNRQSNCSKPRTLCLALRLSAWST